MTQLEMPSTAIRCQTVRFGETARIAMAKSTNGKGELDIAQAHQGRVGPAAVEPGDQPGDEADRLPTRTAPMLMMSE